MGGETGLSTFRARGRWDQKVTRDLGAALDQFSPVTTEERWAAEHEQQEPDAEAAKQQTGRVKVFTT